MPEETETIKLDGREFRPIDQALAAAQDDYILVILRRSGALELLTKIPKDASLADRALRAGELVTIVLESGLNHRLLAGMLTEVGKKWTREEAERNAARFAEITDGEEKLTMHRRLVGFIVSFFPSGEPSSMTSPNSSSQSETAPATTSAEAATSAASP
jgi:hypothetical protein